MAIKDTDRKARANYKKKVVTVRVELYGTDEDIREHVEKLKEAGESVQGYIKDLIRADMHEQSCYEARRKAMRENDNAGLDLGKIVEDLSRAEREANMLEMKRALESHEKWKANHPRPKRDIQK
jgi:predicted transcriptional regulator